MRRLEGIVLRLLLGSLAGLLLAEAGTRLYLTWAPGVDGDYLSDRDTDYRLRHGAESDTVGFGYVNRLGFRDREPTEPKPPGVRRVIGIGDSFVLGEVAPSDNFLRVAERELAAVADSPRTEILMMGLGGYGPEQYVGVLRACALPLQPDEIVLCFYVGNDVLGLATRSVVRRGVLYPTSSADRGLDLLRRSWLFAMLEHGWAARQRHAGRDAGTGPQPASPEVLGNRKTERWYRTILRHRLPVFAREPAPRTARLWSAAEDRLEEFHRLCLDAGVPWSLVLIPDEIQVDDALRGRILPALTGTPDAYDFDAPQHRLQAWAAARGVPLLDLLAPMRARCAEGELLYRIANTHWNEAGNREAGRILAEALRAPYPGRTSP